MTEEDAAARRDELIGRYGRARDRLDSALLSLRADTRVGGWSVAEIAAHVAAWEERAASLVPQLAIGGTAPDVDVDGFNAAAAAGAIDGEARTNLARYVGARRSFVAALENAPTAAFVDGPLVEQIGMEAGHALEHAAELRAAAQGIETDEAARFATAPLETIWSGWEGYQRQLAAVTAWLDDEHLELRAAPGLRSIGEQLRHIVLVRVGWLHGDLGEGGPEWDRYFAWDQPDAPPPAAAELWRGLNETWDFVCGCIDRWTPEQLAEVVNSQVPGDEALRYRRGWVVYHLLEHDIHHGGELAFVLGMHGLPAPRI